RIKPPGHDPRHRRQFFGRHKIKSSPMRLFTAIDLPTEIVDRLRRLISELRRMACIQWSPAANLHITVKFIGQWPEERLPELSRALNGLATRAPTALRVG